MFPEKHPGRHCPLRRAEYCVKDRGLLLGATGSLLAERFDGNAPSRDSDQRKSSRFAPTYYEAAWKTPEAMALVKAALDARFAEPVIERNGRMLHADVGSIPFTPTIDDGELRGGPGELKDAKDGPPRGQVALGPRLRELADAHPDADVVHVIAGLPGVARRGPKKLELEEFHVAFIRSKRQLVLLDSMSPRDTRYIATLAASHLDEVIASSTFDTKEMDACHPSMKNTHGMGPATRVCPL